MIGSEAVTPLSAIVDAGTDAQARWPSRCKLAARWTAWAHRHTLGASRAGLRPAVPSMADDIFRHRRHAGQVLAAQLVQARIVPANAPVLVLALPRGGVPVAYEVARALRAPLDVFVVRKLGVPGHEEYAMGALASGGLRVLHDDAVRSLGITPEEIEAVAAVEQRELERREARYRGLRAPLQVQGHALVVVDDGLATGATMQAAVRALRQLAPAHILVAVPTGAADTCALLRREADAVVCARMPAHFGAVGAWYADFTQTSDEEVQALLEAAQGPQD